VVAGDEGGIELQMDQVIENSIIVTKMCTGLHRLLLNRSIEMKCIDSVEAVKAYS